ncbi:DsbA family oxidoreductase [Nannocystaceae bacterium ST9]
MDRVDILHFSDILCVWAYVEQVRMDELAASFGDRVRVSAHFVQVFGDARTKLTRGWSERGGQAGYAAHVREICERLGVGPIHPACWARTLPASSLACHLWLRAIGVAEADGELEAGALERAARALRTAFFQQGLDVSQAGELRRITDECGLERAAIEAALETGTAHAALDRDLELARTHDVRMSPTLVFNEGRQRLAGNVGYRMLAANVRELLEHGAGGASWC